MANQSRKMQALKHLYEHTKAAWLDPNCGECAEAIGYLTIPGFTASQPVEHTEDIPAPVEIKEAA